MKKPFFTLVGFLVLAFFWGMQATTPETETAKKAPPVDTGDNSGSDRGSGRTEP